MYKGVPTIMEITSNIGVSGIKNGLQKYINWRKNANNPKNKFKIKTNIFGN